MRAAYLDMATPMRSAAGSAVATRLSVSWQDTAGAGPPLVWQALVRAFSSDTCDAHAVSAGTCKLPNCVHWKRA